MAFINKPILTIAIPTYNRAEYLKLTLDSIVGQERFLKTNEVEIVISDNFSSDNTEDIAKEYTKIHGDKVRYYRNSVNILDNNYEKVLSYGCGRFLKLNNDTLLHHDNTLDIIIKEINQSDEEREILFFSCGTIKNIDRYNCNNLDSFIKTASFFITWIACFGIWKKDFDSIKDFSRIANLQLVQVDILFRLISSGKTISINNSKIFTSLVPKNKGIYNFYKVFLQYYIQILEVYVESNLISKQTLFYEKNRIFMGWLVPSILNLSQYKKPYPFTKREVAGLILKKYAFHPALYIGGCYLCMKMTQLYIKDLFK